MKTYSTRQISSIALSLLVISIPSCKYPEGPKITLKTKTSRLTGSWEVQKIDGEDATGIKFVFEFDKDGSGKVSAFGYENDMEWEWENNKKELSISTDDETERVKLQRLTNSELIWKDNDLQNWELEKK